MLDWFDKILATNLPQNFEKWQTLLLTLDNKPVENMYVPHEDKWKSVNLTAKRILETACEYDRTLFVEDDLLLTDNYQEQFEEAVKHLPEDWDMIYFGANLQRYSYQYNDHWVKVGGAWTAHCIGLNKRSAKFLLDEFNKDGFVVGDALFMYLQQTKKINAYLITPMVAYQRAGWSDLQDKWVSYNGMMDTNFGKFVQEKELFTKTIKERQ